MSILLFKTLIIQKKNSKPCAGSKSPGYAFKPAMSSLTLRWE